jgi:ATP-dependent helicase HrpA
MELIDLVNQGLVIVDIAREVVEMLERLRAPGAMGTRTDAHDHLDRLVGPGMLAKVGGERVDDLERWVNGIRYRLQHLAGRVERDLAGIREMAPVERRLAERLAEYPNGAEPNTLRELGFMIEELRVAVFAQELGVAQQVSAVRLLRQLG